MMKTIAISSIGLLISALLAGPAMAFSHANQFGGARRVARVTGVTPAPAAGVRRVVVAPGAPKVFVVAPRKVAAARGAAKASAVVQHQAVGDHGTPKAFVVARQRVVAAPGAVKAS